jgi:hypothetical protein
MNSYVYAELASVAVADRLRAAERARAGRGMAVARRRHRRPATGATVARRVRVLARARTA